MNGYLQYETGDIIECECGRVDRFEIVGYQLTATGVERLGVLMTACRQSQESIMKREAK